MFLGERHKIDPLSTVNIPWGKGGKFSDSVLITFLPPPQFATERALVRKQGRPVMSSGNHAAPRGGCPVPWPPMPTTASPAASSASLPPLCACHTGVANADRAFKHFALLVLRGTPSPCRREEIRASLR